MDPLPAVIVTVLPAPAANVGHVPLTAGSIVGVVPPLSGTWPELLDELLEPLLDEDEDDVPELLPVGWLPEPLLDDVPPEPVPSPTSPLDPLLDFSPPSADVDVFPPNPVPRSPLPGSVPAPCAAQASATATSTTNMQGDAAR
jgi:hypothetical protein